jgi:hypothetical protein
MVSHEINQDVPNIVMAVAYQPTARGGPNHFVAGNIRIVNSAKGLLGATGRERPEPSNWMAAYLVEKDGDNPNVEEQGWKGYLESTHGLEVEYEGDINYEQLLITNQSVYACQNCSGDAFL